MELFRYVQTKPISFEYIMFTSNQRLVKLSRTLQYINLIANILIRFCSEFVVW